ncbi:hypothetical protein D7Y23_15085 [Corallococcus sp. AB050B]|nr:hypothetical protein D7Y23_15085 [Corallococcus sp. AB050B]
MIERARPLALPASVWRRSSDETWSIRDAARSHIQSLSLDSTDSRLRALQDLYVRFAEERKKVPVSAQALQAQNYTCALCGMHFYNDELVELGLVSPLGNRPRQKQDALKPHWTKADLRKPTVDHLWPVSLYGNNSRNNLVVLCRGCNEGKSNYMSIHQTRPFVGLPYRRELREAAPVSPETFFAQIYREPSCKETGKTSKETELTVRLKNRTCAPVLDNLETISSSEI